jgi:hypothetical protein
MPDVDAEYALSPQPQLAGYLTRSVVHGFGQPSAPSRVAGLLLNIGLPANERCEFDLEGPAGFQSVSPLSAEATFWVGYDYTL